MFSNNLVLDIIKYLDQNINHNVTIDELSILLHYDKTYIMKLFKKEIGIPIKLYMNKIRIYNSLKDYSNDNYILKIALKNGFNSLEYYSEVFKNIVGVSPIIYKNFIFSRLHTSEKNMNVMSFNIANLEFFIEYIEKYKNNKKPLVDQIKKLTLFK